MSPEISEQNFEADIEAALLAGGPDDPNAASEVREARASYGRASPWEYDSGGFQQRHSRDFNRTLGLLERDVFDFIYATQPQTWERLKSHYGSTAKDAFLKRLSREIEKRGTLDVLRNGIKDRGCKFELAYFRPASGLNPDIQLLYEANGFSVVRQLHYSEHSNDSLDLVLILNGIPIFSAELKNPLNGQNVEDAIRQYRQDRDPHEPLLAPGRCLAHFAVDTDLVYVTTKLKGSDTTFLPLNRGKYGGAGNPPTSPTRSGYPTDYLWNRIWARDSILDLVQYFIHDVDETDENGRKTGKTSLIFPRYHQLDAVRRLVDDAHANGSGQRYLIQHSAGSGKSFTIAWLAHRLSVLHDDDDQRVFDSIIVISDRRALDRHLQHTVRQFEQTLGVVENIDTTSKKLQEALESGKTIIVTTLQKFPVIAEEIQQLAGQRFAVIIDEAHSSQTGESTKHLKSVLATGNLESAEEDDSETTEDVEERVLAEMRARGPQPNASFFAFTATPKPKTLEIFGTPRDDGSFEPFSLYSMRQAIEEGFILDVLENYTTYQSYWRLLKTIEHDPRYDPQKASYLLRSFVDLHEHAIRQKVEIMAEHFHAKSAHRIRGQAKAMVVTRSRLHAVRFRRTFDEYLEEQGYPYKALVAFSGTVRDGGIDYTERGMNGIPEVQTAEAFKRNEFRFLIVANKYQTGFDQPLLHTMYMDKKLGGVAAVQTLSRLNRVHPDKDETIVLDFANEAEEIEKAFRPYYEKTLLSEASDPNALYDLERQLLDFPVYTAGDVDAFAELYFTSKTSQDQLYAQLAPIAERFEELTDEEQSEFRSLLDDYTRQYAFLSQVIPFEDADLEKLYVFARLLRRRLPVRQEELPREIQQNIDMESFRIRETYSGPIKLDRGEDEIEPLTERGHRRLSSEDDLEPLSQIIDELNQRFGTDLGPQDRVTIENLENQLADDEALTTSVRVNAPENARLAFEHTVEDRLQEMVDTNFKLYKRITDDREFARFFLDWLFERFRQHHEQ